MPIDTSLLLFGVLALIRRLLRVLQPSFSMGERH
jgi:hypothetical protein